MCLKKLAGKPICLSVVLILGISAPFRFELSSSSFIVPSITFAKDGGDGGGGDSDGGGDSGGGSDGGGNSGSGGGNSGSGGSGNSGSGNGNSGSGKSGSGGTNNNSANNSATASNSKTRPKNGISNIERGGKGDIEVHYNNGWTERIKSGLYELRDNINRKVIGRKARQDDYDRFRDISSDR